VSDPGARRTPEQRAAFRAFAREHHPDHGGDPETFAAGVERFRAVADHGGAAAADAPADAGPSAEPVGPVPSPVRVAVALIRTWRRRHERPGSL
jgi:hypothetical protein